MKIINKIELRTLQKASQCRFEKAEEKHYDFTINFYFPIHPLEQGLTQKGTLVFHCTLAYTFKTFYACLDMDAYDAVVEIEDSEFLKPALERWGKYTTIGSSKDYKQFQVYFDDHGGYEILAKSFEIVYE